MKGLEHLHHSTIELINKLSQKRLKVLALDFDNTLYGGVVGEDGYEGIIIGESGLGAIYRDVQYRIKRIKDSGIILVGLTKNNEEDMLSVFDNPNMILSKNDFVTVMANWDEKSQNIKKIANKLNLGLDSFVFLDDNYIERSKMSIAVPEVIVPDFPVDLSEYPVFLEEIYNRYFWIQNETKEDKVKTDQYSQEFKRSELSSKFDNLSDYLKSLDTKISISKLSKEQFERTLQLINKTNQFNLTTIRFNRSELLEFIENDNHIIYTVSVTDRFGSSGLVSVYMIKRNNDEAEVVNFIMSCRVMGRKIENGIVFSIENGLYDMGIKKIKTRYINTPKSDPVKDLWGNLGYDLYKSDENSKEYEKILKNKNEIEDIYEITMEGKK
jgi:FkbH-like protein